MKEIPALLRRKEGFALGFFPFDKLPPESVLIGAFTSETKEEGPLPSPTLLLNASFFERDELLKIALAEKARFEENVYKAYLLDTRAEAVAILSKDPDRLASFLAAYGGLFNARAFSLKKDARFPLIEDLTVEETEGGFWLRYLRFAPFDRERCSRCALCGRACPKGAISPDLVIDPTRCDGCRECEKVCPEGALELFRYEEVSEKVRFLLFLEEIPEEIPKRPGLVFSGEELPDFLAQLGTFEVVESVRFSPQRCQFAPRFEAGCKLCTSSCPRKALSFGDNGLWVEHFLCKDCGRCISICPTWALEYSLFDDRSMVTYLETLPSLEGRKVVIGREETLRRLYWSPSFPKEGLFFFLAHEAPKALSLAHLLALIAKGAEEIIFLEKGPLAAERVNLFFESLFGMAPVRKASFEELNEKTTQGIKFVPKVFPFTTRRKWLVQLIQHFWEAAGKPEIKLPFESFGRLNFDEKACTLCLACLNECQVEALAPDPARYALTFEPALCVACGLCVKVCPEGAITLEEGLFLGPEFFTRKTLAQDEPVMCRRCGKVFGTKKSQQKVATVLAASGRFTEILNLLDFCDECRVKEIFEKEGGP